MIYTTVDGSHPFLVSASGQLLIEYAIGQLAPVASLQLIGGGTINLNGGSIATLGNQTYAGNVVFGSNTSFTSGSDTNISFNGNVSGAGDVNVMGGGGISTLTVNSGSAQTWDMTGTHTGSLSLLGLSGNFSYDNIQTLVGGNANDTFIVNSPVSNVLVNGGSGLNTLVFANGGNNVVSITGVNAGDGFNDIQSLMLNGDGNLITFTSNGRIDSVNAGNINDNNVNTFDFSNVNGNAVITLGSDIFDGSITVNGSTMIGSYAQVNNLIGNPLLNNVIHLPDINTKNSFVVYTNAAKTQGYIGDPTYFTNFTIYVPHISPPAPLPPISLPHNLSLLNTPAAAPYTPAAYKLPGMLLDITDVIYEMNDDGEALTPKAKDILSGCDNSGEKMCHMNITSPLLPPSFLSGKKLTRK